MRRDGRRGRPSVVWTKTTHRTYGYTYMGAECRYNNNSEKIYMYRSPSRVWWRWFITLLVCAVLFIVLGSVVLPEAASKKHFIDKLLFTTCTNAQSSDMQHGHPINRSTSFSLCRHIQTASGARPMPRSRLTAHAPSQMDGQRCTKLAMRSTASQKNFESFPTISVSTVIYIYAAKCDRMLCLLTT